MLADRPDAETSNRLAHQARCRASDRQPIDSESTISEDLRNGPPVEQLKPVLPAERFTAARWRGVTTDVQAQDYHAP